PKKITDFPLLNEIYEKKNTLNDINTMNKLISIIYGKILDKCGEYPHPECLRQLCEKLQFGPLRHEVNNSSNTNLKSASNVIILIEKIKNKFRNLRTQKPKQTKTSQNVIKNRHFLKKIYFDLEDKDYQELSNQDIAFYYKILNNQGKFL